MINNLIIGKLSKFFISDVCIKPELTLSFKKVFDPVIQ